ncbi:MAG: hypothetical protein FWE37_03910 [Spirochaetaceae bacterium]|nr:hypothetical protein [Spirochaetaceae bacterium]
MINYKASQLEKDLIAGVYKEERYSDNFIPVLERLWSIYQQHDNFYEVQINLLWPYVNKYSNYIQDEADRRTSPLKLESFGTVFCNLGAIANSANISNLEERIELLIISLEKSPLKEDISFKYKKYQFYYFKQLVKRML